MDAKQCDNCNQEITDDTLSLRTHMAGLGNLQLCEPCLRGAIVERAAPKLLAACEAAFDHVLAEGGYTRGRNQALYIQLFDAIRYAKEPASSDVVLSR
ncbi:MAG: hypothetical protein WC651_03300 [Candidatus Gracilibacteria bacterium]|jgi:hypothetical protein